jgi:CDP-diacylglycerol--glycerol-3-phosphate 3-phosphatidyltransferase
MMSGTATAPQTQMSKRPPILNLPNQLTASRFLLAIVLFILIGLEQWIACAAVFAVAAFTDWLDGYLARLWNLGSTLGRNLDPLVDKILICGAFIFLLQFKEALTGLNPWMVTVIVTRELVVTSLRSFIENRGGSFGAAWPGKLKMGLQCAALFFLFLCLSWQSVESLAWTFVIRDVLNYAMVISTVISGLQYLLRATALLREE